MRTWAGWAAATILAAGCGGGMWGGDGSASAGGGNGGGGGSGGSADGAGGAGDERAGADVVCAACKVTGGGQLEVAGRRVEVSVEAAPDPGEGLGAAGVPATGRVQLHEVGGGEAIDLAVDAILSCRRESGRLVAAIAGPLGGGSRFEVDLVDGGEPADDRVSWSGLCGGDPVPLANGNLQVHDLESCQPAGDGGAAGAGGGEGGGTLPTDGGGTGGDGTGGTPPGDFVPM
jgi:hypothetical protein